MNMSLHIPFYNPWMCLITWKPLYSAEVHLLVEDPCSSHSTHHIEHNSHIWMQRSKGNISLTACRWSGQSPSRSACKCTIIINTGLMKISTHIFVVRILFARSSSTVIRSSWHFSCPCPTISLSNSSATIRIALIFMGNFFPVSILPTSPNADDKISANQTLPSMIPQPQRSSSMHTSQSRNNTLRLIWICTLYVNCNLVEMLICCEQCKILFCLFNFVPCPWRSI